MGFDSTMFKHVFLREPHAWINFLLSMGISLSFPEDVFTNSMEYVVDVCFGTFEQKPLLTKQDNVFSKLLTAASISRIEVVKYLRKHELQITADLVDCSADVHRFL